MTPLPSVPPARSSSYWKGALFATSPVVIGIGCLLGTWILHFTKLEHGSVGIQVWKALAITFVLTIWIGPISAVVAIALAEVGRIRGWRRIVCFVVNGLWFLFTSHWVFVFLTRR